MLTRRGSTTPAYTDHRETRNISHDLVQTEQSDQTNPVGQFECSADSIGATKFEQITITTRLTARGEVEIWASRRKCLLNEPTLRCRDAA